jgi:hypothetical protein
MDGLQVLKGGTAKATVYFDTKDATKNALDLNEQEISIGLPAAPATAEPNTIEEIEKALTGALSAASFYGRKLVEMAAVKKEEPGHPLFPEEKAEA